MLCDLSTLMTYMRKMKAKCVLFTRAEMTRHRCALLVYKSLFGAFSVEAHMLGFCDGWTKYLIIETHM